MPSFIRARIWKLPKRVWFRVMLQGARGANHAAIPYRARLSLMRVVIANLANIDPRKRRVA
jgi:hypothetical protein